MFDEGILHRIAAILRTSVEQPHEDDTFWIESNGPDSCFSLWIDRKDGTVGCWYRRQCDFGADIQISFHCDEITFADIDGTHPTIRFWRHDEAGRVPVMQVITNFGAVWTVRYSALGVAEGGFGQV